jgi:rod shape-determining protein MreD
MLRGLTCVAAVALAVVVQLTIINRIAFPGGTGPDVVLLTVAALALATGPLAGSLIGFWAGLAMDVAPPGSHFVGQDALVFCLIGYACGLVADVPSSEGVPEQGHTALFEIMVTAVAAVCGEALGSLLGAMLSDLRVTWPAIKHVLPAAVLYDVLLCPFVLYAVAAVLRLAGTPRRVRATVQPRRAAARPAGLAQVTPRLRMSERGKGDGLTALRGPRGRTLTKHEPRLKLGQGSSARAAASLGAAFASGGAAKVKFGTGRSGGVLGGSPLGGAAALNSGLAGPRRSSSRFGPTRMGRSLLGGSVFSRSPSALRSPSLARRPALMGRTSFLGRSSWAGRPPLLSRSSLRRASSFGRSSALGRSSAFRQPIGGRSPGRGWLGGSSLRRGRAGRGLTPGRIPGRRSGPARLHMRRSRWSRRRRTGGYR